MNIIITGGTGFLGQHILKELAKTKSNVIVVSRSKFVEFDSIKSIIGDINNYDKINKKLIEFDPEVIIHLAWQGIPDFSANMCQNNLSDSIRFFDWVFENTNCKKVLVSGSCFEYGKKRGACNESDSVNIDSYFTWAKNSLNEYLQIKCIENDIALNWFRIFYVYGPGQRDGSLIPTLIKSIGASETPEINTPLNKNDFVYVGDVARAFVKAVDVNLPSGVYNLGSGFATSVYDICKIVEKRLLDTEIISTQVLDNGQLDETVNFWADMKKTEKTLNLNCDTNLDEGIKQYMESMQPEAVA